MDESLTMRRRVQEEGLRVVNCCQGLRRHDEDNSPCLTKAPEEAPAKSVPAAAVIRMEQALFGITGHKAHVGGLESRM